MNFHIPQSSRLAALAAVAVLSVGAAKQAAAADLATTLASNPQFSDFVTQLRMAGVWPSVQGAQNVTIFAPTNAAIERTQGWQTQLVDSASTTATFGTNLFTYQNQLLGTVIKGVHPASDFAGKAQPVHTLGKTVYWVDGRTGGAILVGNKAPSTGEMGATASSVHMAPLGQPISADNGMIYPIDSVVR